jgi:hypothetical protein
VFVTRTAGTTLVLSSRDLRVRTIEQPRAVLSLPNARREARAFNPSLVSYRGKLVVAFRISSLTRCRQQFVDFDTYYSGEEPPIQNAVGVAYLDVERLTLHEPRRLDVPVPSACLWTHGFEDPRVFARGESIYLLVAHRAASWVFGLSLIELDEDLQPRRIVPVDPDFDVGMHHKNWNPFLWNDRVLFVTDVAPHRIAAIDFETGRATRIHETGTDVFDEFESTHHLRGSTGYVRCGDRFVGICRTVLRQAPELNTNEYMSVAYAFEAFPPFQIKGRTQPFQMGPARRGRKPMQMPTGLIELGDVVLIAFGENDCDLRIARVKKERLLVAIR